MTIEEIWEVSRHNDYSWMLPTVLCCGTVVLILLNFIKNTPIRRTMKVLFALGFICLAVHASSVSITEKWSIRREWGQQEWDNLSKQERNALCADGANLLIEPLIDGGGYAFLLFGGTLVASRVVRKLVSSEKSQQAPAGDSSTRV